MLTPFVKRIVYDAPEDDVRRIETALRAGLRKATQTWQKDVAPRHFRYGAQGRYGYKQRSRKYRDRKMRVYGHRRPLVYSDESEHWVLTRRAQPKTRRTRVGLTATLPVVVPKYFFMYRGAGSDKYAELTATLPEEYEQLFQGVDAVIETELQKPTRPRRKHIGHP